MTEVTDWPPGALTLSQVAEHLRYKGREGVEQAIRRTKQGRARVPFPDPDGYAVPPSSARAMAQRYWLPGTVSLYARRADRLAA